MPMKKTLSAFVALSALLAVSTSFAASGPDGATLLKERCGSCHAVSRTTGAKKSKTDWDKTVVRMMGKGAKLSLEERRTLVTYLANTYK
ncbi:MAG: hypothetical protein FIA91_05000 [Geobacter sp.]|nr:hypothetical protein [Geobacter sp.]